jgi:autotransporter strand-loop-strand O-heptosyltransferase
MSKQKLLVIAPHLSTGGLPQYLYVKISKLVDTYNIYVCMWSDIAPIYNVQLNKIKSIIPRDNFIYWPQGTPDDNKNLIEVLHTIQPYIVHIEEYAESFLPNNILKQLYSSNRQYKIIETTHDSAFDTSKKVYMPDAFTFVSDSHPTDLPIPTYVVKYPIEYKESATDKKSLLVELGLDPSYKHVLNVGLFTPGKNQKEVFDIARMFGDSSNVLFHFIGNTANNFKEYWRPLIDDKPDNCILHGERFDVDKWYEACDLLLFTSKSELNPLVPREAIAWHTPVLMYNLPIYNNEYDKYEEVEYLTNNTQENYQRVRKSLGMSVLSKKRSNIKLVHLLTRPDDEREVASVKSLEPLRKWGVDYKQHINEPETQYPQDNTPITNHIIKKPGYYGAYKAFRRAIEEEFTEDIDYLMICECDCILTIPHKKFIDKLHNICDRVINKYEISYFSFGATGNGDIVWSENIQHLDNDTFLTNKIILAHCILFPKNIRKWLLQRTKDVGWDSPDIWLNYVFENKRKAIIREPLAVQHEGMSLIDNEIKTGEGRGQVLSFDLEKSMGEQLIDIYDNTTINKKSVRYNYNFRDGAFLEVLGSGNESYLLEAIDMINNKIVYADTLKPNHYIRTARKYFTQWLLRVSQNKETVFEHRYNANNKNVLITFGSKSLGDTIAWLPYVEEFRKKHKTQNIYCSTFWNQLFINVYPYINFIRPGTQVNNIYATYNIEFTIPYDTTKNPTRPNTVPLQKVASDILGLQYEEIRPRIYSKAVKKKDQICFSINSTAQCKYWNHPTGWQEVIDYINSIGLKAINISKERDNYMGNRHPKRAIDHTGNNHSIESRIKEILSSKMFIGVGSGLSWLAWALEVPVILISGFSQPWCEFSTGVERIINTDGCYGCFNDPNFEFDRGDWNWCPRHKNFECTKNIDPQKVIKSIDKILLQT